MTGSQIAQMIGITDRTVRNDIKDLNEGLKEYPDSYVESIRGKLIKENVIANPKSIFTVLAAGLGAGTVIKIQAEGSDEKQAVDDLCEFIASLKE